MTTITIDRSLLEQALVALSAPNHCVFSEPPICVDIRAALAASATAPEPMFWVRIRSDGMYEGPLHNAQIEKVRKESGSWRPLYMHPPAHQEQLKPGECWPERIMKQWDEMRDLISKGAGTARFHLMEINHETSPIPIPRQ
jgi:hypothetical protein